MFSINKNKIICILRFQPFIPDEVQDRKESVKRLILCSGLIYFNLVKLRKERKEEVKIAVARVEQINPFPYRLLANELEKYPQAEIVWAQYEPKDKAW